MPRKTKQNKITSEDLIAQINPENKQLLEDYVAYMKSVSRSDKTIEGYISDLHIFFVWLLQKANNKFFVNITKRDVVAFQGYMVNTLENSPARIRRVKSSLSALSNYIEAVCDDDYPQFKNIINKVENPLNAPVREKTVLSDEQLDELLDYLSKSGRHQQACLLALGMQSGARKSELVRFKPSFFTEDNVIFGSLYKTPKIKTKGRSGGKYIPKFVFKAGFQPYFDDWMKQREELCIESEWLFVKQNGERWDQLNSDTLNSWAITFGNHLGVDFYFHALRHYWTTSCSKKGLPTSVIKDLQQWNSESMVSLYSDLSEEDTFAKYFDVNGIKSVEQTTLLNI